MEYFSQSSVFMDVYNFNSNKFILTLQCTDTQIGISTENDNNPFTGYEYVFSTEKDAKEFIKQHLGFSKTIIAENKSEAAKIENTKSRVFQTGKLIAVGR
ncbi:MAG: hypothetical protein EAZ53_06600 [Bacteroidetes bacterium]|nr:MAG: hypothetical protein EAZ53_06600 [Bacteroidota bacterium]